MRRRVALLTMATAGALLTSMMPADATPTVIEHELGHAIGLGDDRDAAGNAFNGGLMAGGSRNADGTMNTENACDEAVG